MKGKSSDLAAKHEQFLHSKHLLQVKIMKALIKHCYLQHFFFRNP